MPTLLAIVLLALLCMGSVTALAPALRGGRPWSEMRAVIPLVAAGWLAFALLLLL